MGISAEDQQKVSDLRREDFEPKLWLALVYARNATLADGGQLSGKWLAELHKTYTQEQIACLDKIVRIQSFANFFMSTARILRNGKKTDQAASCRLPATSLDDDEDSTTGYGD